MARSQQGLQLKDLIEAQRKLAGQGDERAAKSLQRLEAMDQQFKAGPTSTSVAKSQGEVQANQARDTNKQVAATKEVAAKMDTLTIDQRKALIEKGGDGVNSNIIKLTDEIKKSNANLDKLVKGGTQGGGGSAKAAAPGKVDDTQDIADRNKEEAAKYQGGGWEYLKNKGKQFTSLGKTGSASGGIFDLSEGKSQGFLGQVVRRAVAKREYREDMNQVNPQMKNLPTFKNADGTVNQKKIDAAWNKQFEAQNAIRGKMAKTNENIADLQSRGASEDEIKRAGLRKDQREQDEAFVNTAPRLVRRREKEKEEAKAAKDSNVISIDEARKARERAEAAKAGDLAKPKKRVGNTRGTVEGSAKAAKSEAADDVAKANVGGAAASLLPKAGSEEADEENIRLMGDQNETLNKIEENTRPDKDSKPKLADKAGGGAGGGRGGGGGGFLDGLGKGLTGLGKGIAGLGRGIGQGIKGFLVGLAEGIAAFGKTDVLKGAAALVVLSGALWITSKALNEFNTVDWSSILKGGIALLGLVGIAKLIGNSTGEMIKGALGIAALGAALWVAGKGFQTFQELDWSSIGKGLLAVAGLGVLAAVLGAAIGPMLLGAAALAALGAAMWVVGKAFQAVGEGLEKTVGSFERLGKLDGGNLFAVAGGIVAIGAALAIFAGTQVVAGVGNLISRFLNMGGDSPVEQLIKIGEVGDGILAAANGIEKLGKSIEAFGKVDAKKFGEVLKVLNDEFPWIKATLFVKAGGSLTAKSGDTSVTAGPAGKEGAGGPQAPGATQPTQGQPTGKAEPTKLGDTAKDAKAFQAAGAKKAEAQGKLNDFLKEGKEGQDYTVDEWTGARKYKDPKKQAEYDKLVGARNEAADAQRKVVDDRMARDGVLGEKRVDPKASPQRQQGQRAIGGVRDDVAKLEALKKQGFKDEDFAAPNGASNQLTINGKKYDASKINAAYNQSIQRELSDPGTGKAPGTGKGDQVATTSAAVAAGDKAGPAPGSTVVNAPQTNVTQSTQNVAAPKEARNTESAYLQYNRSRFAF